jgi:hypothetical protein
VVEADVAERDVPEFGRGFLGEGGLRGSLPAEKGCEEEKPMRPRRYRFHLLPRIRDGTIVRRAIG